MRSLMRRSMVPLLLVLLVSPSVRKACGAEAALREGTRRIAFQNEVVNLENMVGRLASTPTARARGPVSGVEGVWYGEIRRQLPGDAASSQEHNVPFAVWFERGKAARIWCDANMNGDLEDDVEPALSVYPGPRPARSFLTRLRWNAVWKGVPLSIDRLERVVIEDLDSLPIPKYRTQDVYAPLGEIEIEGHSRAALLYDANRDGIYARGNTDGLFIDLDGDRHFPIDVMAQEFTAFALPLAVGQTVYAVDEVDPRGRGITIRAIGAAREFQPLSVGSPAPDVTFTDLSGKAVRLVDLRGRVAVLYFWASWCPSCLHHAEALPALYRRYNRTQLEILGINYDTDRDAMERFREAHGYTWPTSFTGGQPAEDPVGKAYREGGVGVFYIIDRDGRLAAREFDPGEVERQIQKLLTKASQATN